MTKHIGIVAGSSEGAALCYRTICLEAPAMMGEHNHPEITINSLPMAEHMRHIVADDWAAVAELMLASAHKVAQDRDRDAILQLPKSASNSPLPLLLFLHGATQSADDMFWYLDSAPDETGVAILAPNSRDTTWDAITGSFGPDVDFLNRALERTFETVAIDPARMAIGGFSDGATYAISLGLINGDFFKRVAAFSPGFIIDGATQGKPGFFISHGMRDHMLPIDRCGRRIATDLKTQGYEVTFREFDGDHEIPAAVMREGLRWVAK